jgi:tetratricopeptide (TPR) repeat protein
VQLKLRAAWIEAQRGNRSKAIALATTALEEHPESSGGWQLLADWYHENEQADEAVQAAENMVKLAPLDPIPLGYLGELKAKTGDKKGAQAAFQRAFTLDPDYTVAGVKLFEMQVIARQLTEAGETLQVLCRRGQTHQTLSCSVWLATVRQEPQRALEQFGTLCAIPQAPEWSIAGAARALDACGLSRSVDRILDEHLRRPDPAPTLAGFWVERESIKGKWGLHSRLNALKVEGESGRRAILRYLDHLGQAVNAARQTRSVGRILRLRYHVWRLLKTHRNWLHSDVEGWGKVGYVLTSIGRPAAVISWLGDWKNRPQAESWMLYNLVVMMHRKGQFEEGWQIIRHAVTLRHTSDLHEIFRLWAAFEEALAGNISLAGQHLATLPPESIREGHRPLQTMTQLLIAQAEGKQDSPAIRSQLRATFGKEHPSQAERYTRAAYRRFMAAVALQAGGFGLRLWGWWYYRGLAWLWIALMVVCAPLIFAAPPLAIVFVWWYIRRSQRA